MITKIKKYMKNNDRLYTVCKAAKKSSDPYLAKTIRGLYDFDHPEVSTLLLEHNGELMPDRIVYDISHGEDKKEIMGFFANMHHLLYRLKFAELINAVPRVRWGEGVPYYDHGMDSVTKNAFEYYFEPISDAAKYPLKSFKNIIDSRAKHISMFQNMAKKSYKINDENLRLLSSAYKKHIHLNDDTKKYIESGISKTLGVCRQSDPSVKILGAHLRGTDFNKRLKNHPSIVMPEEYLCKVGKIIKGGKYDKIFIATEDNSIIDMFVSEFGDRVLYYKDVFRTSGSTSPHMTPNKRELNNYKLGLEVLRDVYTLANCDGFISGLSHVAFAVRYINIAIGRKFDTVSTIDKGIN